MANILLIFCSREGHTKDICAVIKAELVQHNNQVQMIDVSEVEEIDWSMYDKVVIGASIHYGKHSKAIYRLVRDYQTQLERIKNAFFSVNLVARKPEKCSPETNPYVKKFVKQIDWTPSHIEVFAGMLDYQRYRPFDRFMIRLIMWMTKGPTQSHIRIDYTDWSQVNAFAHKIEQL